MSEKHQFEYNMISRMNVYILQRAAGRCIYDRLKMFPILPSPFPHALWKTNARVVTASSCKFLFGLRQYRSVIQITNASIMSKPAHINEDSFLYFGCSLI